MPDPYTIPTGTCIGHIHLKVADIDRALEFYNGVLGFEIMQQSPESAFLSAGGYHHHIGLNTWQSKDQPPAPRHHAGLFHLAIRYPSRRDLANALKRLQDHDAVLDGASDHGVSEALYLRDPDDNGVELYCDRSRDEWPRDAVGGLKMVTERLDLAGLLAAAE